MLAESSGANRCWRIAHSVIHYCGTFTGSYCSPAYDDLVICSPEEKEKGIGDGRTDTGGGTNTVIYIVYIIFICIYIICVYLYLCLFIFILFILSIFISSDVIFSKSS